MKNIFTYLNETFDILKEDRVVITLSLVPIVIGFAFYFFLGWWIVGPVFDWGESFIAKYISAEILSGFFYYLMVGIVTVGLYFIVSWTFVLVVSMLASPFNDFISERVEKKISGKEPPGLGDSFSSILSNLPGVISNEIKKVFVVLILTAIAFIAGLFPILVPVSIIITALLLSFSFLDYSWSRNHVPMSSCFGFLKKNFVMNSFSGLLFQVLFMIPVLNIFSIPFAVVYFTVMFTREHLLKGSIQE
ncbi:MAG: EI24 domain-containing protein [Halobacteriovoraceae bacterium]|nr:EI24 domain-containing protein [Halobacteriovoraceae bacterium]